MLPKKVRVLRAVVIGGVMIGTKDTEAARAPADPEAKTWSC